MLLFMGANTDYTARAILNLVKQPATTEGKKKESLLSVWRKKLNSKK